MVTQRQTSKQYLRSVTVIYYAVLAAQIGFAAVALLLVLSHKMEPNESVRNIFLYVVPVIVLNGFVTGQLIYKSRLRRIKVYDNLLSKTAEYRSALIVRWAMLEGASLFAIAIYLVTADSIFMVFAGIVIAFFLLLKPSVYKISTELELNSTEKMKLDSENEVVAEFQIRG